jgi:hypothetical protein
MWMQQSLSFSLFSYYNSEEFFSLAAFHVYLHIRNFKFHRWIEDAMEWLIFKTLTEVHLIARGEFLQVAKPNFCQFREDLQKKGNFVLSSEHVSITFILSSSSFEKFYEDARFSPCAEPCVQSLIT